VAGGKEEWQLTPLDMGLGVGEGWDVADAVAPPGLAPDHTFLRWIIGGEDASAAMGSVMDSPVLELDHAPSMMSLAFGSTMPFAPTLEDAKPVPFGHTPNFFGSHPSLNAAP
jgi:hypothetical protein